MAFLNISSKSAASSFSVSVFAKYFSLWEAWHLTPNTLSLPKLPLWLRGTAECPGRGHCS